MIERRVFRLVNNEVRLGALECVSDAPEGYEVEVREQKRNLDQNAALWPILEEFSNQLPWPVNGETTQLTPEEWKDVLTAAFKQETRIADGLNGGKVFLGLRTSGMRKREFSEFLDFIKSVAAERGIHLEG